MISGSSVRFFLTEVKRESREKRELYPQL